MINKQNIKDYALISAMLDVVKEKAEKKGICVEAYLVVITAELIKGSVMHMDKEPFMKYLSDSWDFAEQLKKENEK